MVGFFRYVQFYLDLIANPETVSLLYHLALKGKTIRDSESQAHSEASDVPLLLEMFLMQ
jgi:sister-chromatid-cohesion protein PDS5